MSRPTWCDNQNVNYQFEPLETNINSFFLHLNKFVHFQIRIGKEFRVKIEQSSVCLLRFLKRPVYKSSVEEGGGGGRGEEERGFRRSRPELFCRKRCSGNV